MYSFFRHLAFLFLCCLIVSSQRCDARQYAVAVISQTAGKHVLEFGKKKIEMLLPPGYQLELLPMGEGRDKYFFSLPNKQPELQIEILQYEGKVLPTSKAVFQRIFDRFGQTLKELKHAPPTSLKLNGIACEKAGFAGVFDSKKRRGVVFMVPLKGAYCVMTAHTDETEFKTREPSFMRIIESMKVIKE